MCRKQGERAILGQTFLERKKQRVLLKRISTIKLAGILRAICAVFGKKEKK